MSIESLSDAYNDEPLGILEDWDSVELQLYCYFAIIVVAVLLDDIGVVSVPNTARVALLVGAFVPFVQWFFRTMAVNRWGMLPETASKVVVVASPMYAIAAGFTQPKAMVTGAIIIGGVLGSYALINWGGPESYDSKINWPYPLFVQPTLMTMVGAMTLLPILYPLAMTKQTIPVEGLWLSIAPGVALFVWNWYSVLTS